MFTKKYNGLIKKMCLDTFKHLKIYILLKFLIDYVLQKSYQSTY